ncbi:hypothetical protein L7F22_039703 [Adiantum nelumboides]|nr:hypothetical protein [Adiantum nelumboides]
MGTGNQVDSSASARNFLPACRSASFGAQLPLSKNSTSVCSACGHDGQAFHRLKHDGTTRHFCSSCILLLYKGMYCCLCLVVYETPGAKGDSSLWVCCAKCQRIGHIKCARVCNLPVDSELFTCPKCSQPEKALARSSSVNTEGQHENESPPLKRLRSLGDNESAYTVALVDQQNVHGPLEEALAAAQIVALLAVQQAKDAKARARASAALAARAAACAKAALDTAYRVAQEESRWKPESSRRLTGVLPGSNGGLSSLSVISAPSRVMRVDGGVPLQSSLLNSNTSSQLGKCPTTTGYISVNGKVTVQCNKMKALPLSAEATAVVPRSGAFQQPQAVPMQEGLEGVQIGGIQNGGLAMESDIRNVSASPASILDAATSLNTPQLRSSAETGPGHCSVPDAAPNSDRSSSTLLTSNDLPANGAHLHTLIDNSLTSDKKDH